MQEKYSLMQHRLDVCYNPSTAFYVLLLVGHPKSRLPNFGLLYTIIEKHFVHLLIYLSL